MKNKTIEEQMNDRAKDAPEPPTKEQFDNLLEVLTSNNEYPDDLEIFTTDRGWHKVKDYR